MGVKWPITGRLTVEYVVEAATDTNVWADKDDHQFVILSTHPTLETACASAENYDPNSWIIRVRQCLSQER